MRHVQHLSLENLVKMDQFQKEPPLNLKGTTGGQGGGRVANRCVRLPLKANRTAKGQADIVEMSALCRPRCEIGIWNLLACHYVSIGGLLLRLNSHRPQPEYTNEYFLHHRRRGRCTSRCRLLWSAHLNNKILFDLLLGKHCPRLLATYGGGGVSGTCNRNDRHAET
jgi:hypothetical protein